MWGDLRTLLHKQQEQMESVAKQTETEQRSTEWPPSPLWVKIESLEEAIKQYEGGKHTSKRLQWATFWLTLGTMVVLCIAASFTYEQWQASLHSNEINKGALESVQRSFVVFVNIVGQHSFLIEKSGKTPFVFMSAELINTGTTPAIGVAQFIDTRRLYSEPSDEVFESGTPTESHVIGPKAVVDLGNIVKPQTFLFGGDIVRPTQELLRNPPPVIHPLDKPYVWGWLSYHDVFPSTKLHITEFCQELATVHTRIEDPKGNGNLLLGFVYCKHHNCADENCKDYDTIVKKSADVAP